MRNRFSLLAYLLFFVSLVESSSTTSSTGSLLTSSNQQNSSSEQSKFAYITLHYEGTQRDEEYLLGIRVLIKSIQMTGTQHDICVIVPETVQPATKRILLKAGAKLIEVQGIKNPYKEDANRRGTFTDRFDQTLNKLHLWNQTQYERVVYFDADNVVLYNMDDLFHCGEFCAVFMNPVIFHTGLMAIKPDAAVFEDMLDKLQTKESYDGADQGFLVAYFPDFLSAPLFSDRTKDMSNEKLVRLPVNWNINHIYFLEKSSWDFYRRNGFEDHRVPAASIGYPIAPNWKPWYWWPYIWMPVHYEWYAVRLELDEQFSSVHWLPFVSLIAAAISFEFVSGYSILSFYKRYHLYKVFHNTLTKWLMVILWFFMTLIITYKTIPSLVHPNTGIWIFIVTQNFLFYSLFQKVNHTSRNTRLKMLFMTSILLRVIASLQLDRFTLVPQVLFWFIGLLSFLVLELVTVYYYCFKNSSASYFGMDNDQSAERYKSFSNSIDFGTSDTQESGSFVSISKTLSV